MAIDGVTSCMKIREVNKNKKQFISLLLLADEQESMQHMIIIIMKTEKRTLNYLKMHFTKKIILIQIWFLKKSIWNY